MGIMEWLRVTTHMAPMLLQAGLLNLQWTRPEYANSQLIRWIRLSLLPISLSFLLHDLWNLKYNSQLSPVINTNMRSAWGAHACKAVLLAFQQIPSGPETRLSSHAKSTSKSPSTEHHSPVPFPLDIFLLAFALGTTPSNFKHPKILSGVNQNIRTDMIFFLMTLRRLILLTTMGVIASICWKISSDERIVVDHHTFHLIRNFKSEIRAFCCGIFVWIGIDTFGCIPRLSMFHFKMITRLLSRLIPHHSPISKNLLKFNQIDLNQSFPLLFRKMPLCASSITDFWGRHWHSILKDLLIETGVIPVTYVLVNFLGFHSESKIVRMSGIMGAFTVSGLLHEVGIWAIGPPDLTFKTSIFFITQGVGVSLENGYKKLLGRNVNGFLGRVWLFTWLIYFGQPMVSIWMSNFGVDENKLFRRMDERMS
ncbi:hypothetical protein PCANC_07754 [Puccinia coronata f. sp. avenae]|uniref:Wax synthase domain-containing protein n=1 Tax=Puccinia coronata f. sp. avenae TaxID=200324 RepID=A0A2N5VHI1_9BASI|nr:hypothetical protein PCANC_07754 [Puccinia coronata f. sp. avenae]